MVQCPFQSLSDLQNSGIRRSRLESPGGFLHHWLTFPKGTHHLHILTSRQKSHTLPLAKLRSASCGWGLETWGRQTAKRRKQQENRRIFFQKKLCLVKKLYGTVRSKLDFERIKHWSLGLQPGHLLDHPRFKSQSHRSQETFLQQNDSSRKKSKGLCGPYLHVLCESWWQKLYMFDDDKAWDASSPVILSNWPTGTFSD